MANIDISKIGEALNGKADIDLNNTGVFSTNVGGGGVNLVSSTPSGAESKEVVSADYVGSKFNQSVTNCITEIPQDIKLELTNGTLVLKSGSILYKPSGFESDGTTRKFDRIIVETDVDLLSTLTYTYSDGDYSWCYNKDLNKIQGGNNKYNQIQSLQYDGTAQWCMFYDIDNNIIKYTDDTGITWESGYSLPFGLTTLVNGVGNTSIDQVFTGFGYIGSTAFALPGVKVRIPNGVVSSGTPKYRPSEVETVMIYTTLTSDNLGVKFYLGNVVEYGGSEFELFRAGDSVTFRSDSNLYYDTETSRFCSWLPISSAVLTNGVIGSWVSYNVDPAVDGNMTNISKAGRSVLSGIGLPSSKYIDLTLGASESVYIAPASGVYAFAKKSTGANQYIRFRNQGNGLTETNRSVASGSEINEAMFCLKGDRVAVSYTAGGDTIYFRFIFANGEIC